MRYLRTKNAHKQLARTSLSSPLEDGHKGTPVRQTIWTINFYTPILGEGMCGHALVLVMNGKFKALWDCKTSIFCRTKKLRLLHVHVDCFDSDSNEIVELHCYLLFFERPFLPLLLNVNEVHVDKSNYPWMLLQQVHVLVRRYTQILGRPPKELVISFGMLTLSVPYPQSDDDLD